MATTGNAGLACTTWDKHRATKGQKLCPGRVWNGGEEKEEAAAAETQRRRQAAEYQTGVGTKSEADEDGRLWMLVHSDKLDCVHRVQTARIRYRRDRKDGVRSNAGSRGEKQDTRPLRPPCPSRYQNAQPGLTGCMYNGKQNGREVAEVAVLGHPPNTASED